jgi:hypothetical protein
MVSARVLADPLAEGGQALESGRWTTRARHSSARSPLGVRDRTAAGERKLSRWTSPLHHPRTAT